jgi:hypothetical protein
MGINAAPYYQGAYFFISKRSASKDPRISTRRSRNRSDQDGKTFREELMKKNQIRERE